VNQGNSLAPVLFRFAVQAAAESMNKNWQFRKRDLFVSSKNYMSKRDDAKKRQDPLDFNRSFHADDAALIFLSKAERIEGSTFI
jgi:hypothetical protein